MKTAFLRISAVLLGFLVFKGPAIAAGGEAIDSTTQASTLDVAYELYVAGVPFGHVSMSARVQNGEYKAVSTLETKGIVNAVWQAKFETSSSGTLNKGQIRPTVYDSFAQTPNDRREVTLSFGPDGPKSMVSDPPYKDSGYPIDPELLKNALDPLSAGLYLITNLAAEDKHCGVVAPIFDGRRRYDIALTFVKNVAVKMDNGLYAGPVEVCRARYGQIAGYSQTVLKENKNFPTIYAWIVPLSDKIDPSLRYMMPIRIWAETPYGIIAAVASEVKLDGMALAKPG